MIRHRKRITVYTSIICIIIIVGMISFTIKKRRQGFNEIRKGNDFMIITYEHDYKTEKIVTEEEWLQELKFITGSSLEKVNLELYEMLN